MRHVDKSDKETRTNKSKVLVGIPTIKIAS